MVSVNEQNEKDPDIVDIELNSKSGKEIPKGKKYRIKVGREFFVVDRECMTGREILSLAGKTPPEQFKLIMVDNKDKDHRIGLDETVCFTKPGIERFKVLPNAATDGESLKRDFSLLAADKEYLDANYPYWNSIREGNTSWVIIRDFPIPEGYNTATADVALRLDPTYPATQIDMAYFFPALVLNSGRMINAVSSLFIEGKNYQQWSRHRKDPNTQWQSGVDGIETHLDYVMTWLEKEIGGIS